tara:strand:- start:6211 stop:6939 length:729 start_codon:yes stop_codon:yes gene_type:complete
MFELSESMEVAQIDNIGPNAVTCVVIDNLYANPDEVRRFALKHRGEAEKINEYCDFGDRLAIKHKDIRNIKEVVDDFVRNRAIWNNWYDELSYETNWHDAEFLVNFTSHQTLVNNPFGLIPHQDTYLRFQLPSRFGVVIYLNTPEECEGGTNFYSYLGKQGLERSLLYEKQFKDITSADNKCTETYEELFNTIQMSSALKIEAEIGMRYNRMLIYPVDILHAPSMAPGWFKNHERIAQVMFL